LSVISGGRATSIFDIFGYQIRRIKIHELAKNQAPPRVKRLDLPGAAIRR
jgi:hypothetical protein